MTITPPLSTADSLREQLEAAHKARKEVSHQGWLLRSALVELADQFATRHGFKLTATDQEAIEAAVQPLVWAAVGPAARRASRIADELSNLEDEAEQFGRVA